MFQTEFGGLWAGQDKVGKSFFILDRAAGRPDVVRTDKVYGSDAFGARARFTLERGRFRWYGQTARMGLVADGGATQTTTFTGWGLKDSGLGNQTNVISGFTYNVGNFQIGPNVLWQKPTVGPIPADVDNSLYPTVGPRNVSINGDPFAVRSNREMTAYELVIGYDPAPATWLWAWDNDLREDAKLAGSLSLIKRHMPTTQDAASGLFFFGGGLHPGVFPGAPSPHDLWEARLRLVSKVDAETRVVAVLYAGTAESNGSDDRVVNRRGVDARITHGPTAFTGCRPHERLRSVRLPPRVQPDLPDAAHGRPVAQPRSLALARSRSDEYRRARCVSHARRPLAALQRSDRTRGLRVRGPHLPASGDVTPVPDAVTRGVDAERHRRLRTSRRWVLRSNADPDARSPRRRVASGASRERRYLSRGDGSRRGGRVRS
jgi:hypothetical protein